MRARRTGSCGVSRGALFPHGANGSSGKARSIMSIWKSGRDRRGSRSASRRMNAASWRPAATARIEDVAARSTIHEFLLLLVARFGGGRFEPFGVGGSIKGQIAVINFQGQDRERRLEEPAGDLAPVVGAGMRRVPASAGAGIVFDLRLDQLFADLGVPALPVLVLEVVQELRGVIPVVDVPLLIALEVRRHSARALDQRRVIARPAQELAADQGFGGHDRRDFVAWLVRVSDLLRVGGGQVEIVRGTDRPARWPLRRAKICQPKTDVSPACPGE